MFEIIIFSFVIIILVKFSSLTRKDGFRNLIIKRKLNTPSIFEGEKISVSIIVENRKRLPILFMLIEEQMPIEIIGRSYTNRTLYSIGSYERVKKTYVTQIPQRGVYLFKKMDVILGDIFGLFSIKKEIEDYKEVLVYPRIKKISKLSFDNTSYQGDSIVKRWVFKDPLYIKGIREYVKEDRMKDIHWKSSLKMNKLMVKDYDYTSEREFIIIMNNQCDEIYWRYVNKKAVDDCIKVTLATADAAIKEGIKVGAWTNANIISYSNMVQSETKCSSSIKEILELCTRMDYIPRYSFYEYMNKMINCFDHNNTYVIVTSYLCEKDVLIINSLRKKGINLKIVDVSEKGAVPYIRGVEKIEYRGEKH
ncbi:DUF58 domain-containing protein [Haloimpatiens sp. FM7315]|uniref:DUF58 domain-containing protein n=1 Tax=Haloimpatiens sp. FM7315 TaxID=3298609 RepID=UPI00370B8FA8